MSRNIRSREKPKRKTLKAQGNFELKNHLYAICGADGRGSMASKS